MVAVEDFVGEDASVRWRALTLAIFGGAVLAFFEGLIGSFLAFGRELGALWTGLGEFLAELVGTWLNGPIAALSTGWSNLEAAVGSGGILSLLAVAVGVALILYAVAWGVNRIG